mmetsp:Transcript_2592/g.7747  ORF Transcript_2592/g.7747 Transcript_2592/m.7747 type:complete len:138 (-) Transcript_2592:70-483(-)
MSGTRARGACCSSSALGAAAGSAAVGTSSASVSSLRRSAPTLTVSSTAANCATTDPDASARTSTDTLSVSIVATTYRGLEHCNGETHLVALDSVAHLLLPRRDRALDDRVPHRRHALHELRQDRARAPERAAPRHRR